MKVPRAAVYARVSSHTQDHSLQLDELRDVAAKRGWVIVGEYVDHGVSGTTTKRPQLDRLMADVQHDRIDIVAVWRFDRFARSVRHLVVALEEFRARGIDFVSVRDTIDTTTPTGRFQFQVIAAVAELERELIRERVAAGLAAARRRGKRIGRPTRQFDEDRARAMIDAGAGVKATARRLGVSPRTLRRRCGGQKPRQDPRTQPAEISGPTDHEGDGGET